MFPNEILVTRPLPFQPSDVKGNTKRLPPLAEIVIVTTSSDTYTHTCQNSPPPRTLHMRLHGELVLLLKY